MVEHDPIDSFPCECPNCGSNLENPGGVIVWSDIPDKMIGYLVPGEDGRFDFIVERVSEGTKPTIQCADCGEYLDIKLGELNLDPYCEDENGDLFEDQDI